MWIALTDSTLKQRLSGPEYNTITTAALNAGQVAASLITDAIARTVAEVRGYVAASKANVLGEAGTIPDELEDTALVILVCKIITRLPGLKTTLARFSDELDHAVKRLSAVASDNFAIVQPLTAAPADEQPATAIIAVVRRPGRPVSNNASNGLF
jgi:hypothetical protein